MQKSGECPANKDGMVSVILLMRRRRKRNQSNIRQLSENPPSPHPLLSVLVPHLCSTLETKWNKFITETQVSPTKEFLSMTRLPVQVMCSRPWRCNRKVTIMDSCCCITTSSSQNFPNTQCCSSLEPALQPQWQSKHLAHMWCLFLAVSLTHLEKGNLNWGIASIRLPCRHIYGVFSWMLVDKGGPNSLWAVPGMGR